MKNKDISKLTEKYLKETDKNIIGVSYGYNMVDGKFTDEKVISFTVKEKLPMDKLGSNKVLPKIIEHDGNIFHTDVIQGDFKLLDASFCYSEHYTWWQYWQPIPTTPSNRDEKRPLKGGISTTNYTSKINSIGTLGFLAVDTETDSLVGVSNNHVLVDDAFIASERTNDNVVTNISGDISTQPHESGNYGTSNKIGLVKRYVPIKEGEINYVDGAITTIESEHVDNNESWKQEGLTGVTTPMGFASTEEIDSLLVTDPFLFSAGRTSGAKGELETKLKVIATNSAITIDYNKQGVETTVTFSDCIIFVASGTTVTPGDYCFFPIAPGDSGSALIADFSGTKKIIGLCFAGSSINIPLDENDPESPVVAVSFYGIANRIDKVADELNIRAWMGEQVNYSTPNINEIESYVLSGKTSLESFVKDGKTFSQVGLTNSTNIYTGTTS